MSNNINYNKLYTFGGEQTDLVPKTREELMEELESIPAVVVRGHLDHLIEMDTDSEQPRLKWREEAFSVIGTYDLQYLLTFIRKRKIQEEGKKPIIRHTSS